jgi:hypothetical protein
MIRRFGNVNKIVAVKEARGIVGGGGFWERYIVSGGQKTRPLYVSRSNHPLSIQADLHSFSYQISASATHIPSSRPSIPHPTHSHSTFAQYALLASHFDPLGFLHHCQRSQCLRSTEG